MDERLRRFVYAVAGRVRTLRAPPNMDRGSGEVLTLRHGFDASPVPYDCPHALLPPVSSFVSLLSPRSRCSIYGSPISARTAPRVAALFVATYNNALSWGG
jgi:hypothetical protein